jgi:hypothetical protein
MAHVVLTKLCGEKETGHTDWGNRPHAVCKFIEIKLPEVSPVKPMLSNLSVVEVSYQPYSPNPVPADFFLFSGVQTSLKQRFKEMEDITKIHKDMLHITWD